MKNNIRYSGILIGVLIVLTMTGTLEQASAVTSPWARGAHSSTLPTGTVDVISYVGVPNLPNTSAATLVWVGARSISGGDTYLSHPQLRAHLTGNDDWRVTFQIVRGSAVVEFYYSSMYCNPGASVTIYDAIIPSNGQIFEDVEARSGICTGVGVSHYMTTLDYGNSFTQAFSTFESYGTVASTFSPLNGNFKFTNFRTSTDYVTWITRTLTADQGGTPPSCVTSAGGSGINTITFNC